MDDNSGMSVLDQKWMIVLTENGDLPRGDIRASESKTFIAGDFYPRAIAEHIVSLHNASLPKALKQPCCASPSGCHDPDCALFGGCRLRAGQ